MAQQQIRDNRLKEREQRLKDRENAIWEREEKKKQQQKRIAKEREDRKKRRLNGIPMKGDHSEDEGTSHQGDEEEEDDWFFDCVCGVHGSNLVRQWRSPAALHSVFVYRANELMHRLIIG